MVAVGSHARGPGTIQACGIPVILIAGGREVHIEGPTPTNVEWIVLVILDRGPPVGDPGRPAGAAVTRAGADSAGIMAAVVAAVAGVIDGGASSLPQTAIIIAVVFILTGCGVGSVVGWAMRMMVSHLATVGALAVRALPVVLLTALVFFNTYVWLMAATISGDRLALAMAFLITIAGVVRHIRDVERVRPMLRSRPHCPRRREKLADTPFASMPDTAGLSAG